PDTVLYFIARKDPERTADNLSRVLTEHKEIPDSLSEPIGRLFAQSQVDSTMLRSQIERRMMPYLPEFNDELFHLFAQQAAQHHARSGFVYIPEVKEFKYLHSSSRDDILRRARDTGLPVLDLFDSSQSVSDRNSLMVEPEAPYKFSLWKRKN